MRPSAANASLTTCLTADVSETSSQEARRLLLGEAADAAGAAFQVGYESPSQFSREYRRLFGDSPQRDKARLRASAQPAEKESPVFPNLP